MSAKTELPVIVLAPGKEDSLLRFHPWIFSGAIKKLPAGLDEGDMVRIAASDGTVLGTGHYQIGSIAVRVLHFGADHPGDDLYDRRLADAFRLRRALGLIRPDNNSYRLIHGEGDFVPGLVVDVYGDTAVLQAHSVGIHRDRAAIAQGLVSLSGAGIKNVFYKSETTLPFKAQLDPVNDYIIGGNGHDVALENGLRFHIDWLKGQKTGFFLDQRDNRLLLQRYAAGRNVLNTFCYTGGFSVYALAGGASHVDSVDSSAKAIALTDANVRLNFGDDAAHASFATDAFKFIDKVEKGRYDLVVLDPPAFAKHRSALDAALRGYRRLNAAAIARIAPGGILFTFSCSQAVSPQQFRLAVFTAAASTGRRVRILHRLTQPADHPVNIYHPEGEYLKGLVLYVE